MALIPFVLWVIYLSSQGALLPKAPDLSSGQPPKAAHTRGTPTSQLLLQTPGPAAFAKVDLDFYKPKAPKFTKGIKTKSVGTATAPGPAEYNPGKVR